MLTAFLLIKRWIILWKRGVRLVWYHKLWPLMKIVLYFITYFSPRPWLLSSSQTLAKLRRFAFNQRSIAITPFSGCVNKYHFCCFTVLGCSRRDSSMVVLNVITHARFFSHHCFGIVAIWSSSPLLCLIPSRARYKLLPTQLWTFSFSYFLLWKYCHILPT